MLNPWSTMAIIKPCPSEATALIHEVASVRLGNGQPI